MVTIFNVADLTNPDDPQGRTYRQVNAEKPHLIPLGASVITGKIKMEGFEPIPMLLWCPGCGERHIDEGEFATKAHHTHACQTCGNVWRPAVVATRGVRFLPGFKNAFPA